MELLKTDALIIVDPQNDFCPGGALAVEGGDEIMPLINTLSRKFREAGAAIVITQDWHPKGHFSFASAHEGAEPFTDIPAPYGDQTLWPDHCVQGTKGADFHPKLETKYTQVIIRKGYNPLIDSYSAFLENDKATETGLRGWLADRHHHRCFFVGLATDFCVGYSAMDAVGARLESLIIEDATRAIDLNGSLAFAKENFNRRGVRLINSSEV